MIRESLRELKSFTSEVSLGYFKLQRRKCDKCIATNEVSILIVLSLEYPCSDLESCNLDGNSKVLDLFSHYLLIINKIYLKCF